MEEGVPSRGDSTSRIMEAERAGCVGDPGCVIGKFLSFFSATVILKGIEYNINFVGSLHQHLTRYKLVLKCC